MSNFTYIYKLYKLLLLRCCNIGQMKHSTGTSRHILRNAPPASPTEMLHPFRIFLFILLSMTCFWQANAQIGQRINQIKNSDPLSISGNVGTSLGVSYNSNYPGSTPFSGSIFANLNLNIYSFNLPLSFYFVNNTTSFNYPQLPTFRLGATPTWKRFRFHLGNSSMHFNNYTYSGLSFLGAGLEYQGKLFRAAAFGGLLSQATRIKGYDDRTAFQQLADSLLGLNTPASYLPQYRRDAVGVKLGVGNAKNYIDISFLKAKDIEKSLPEFLRDSIPAKDNITLGLSGRFSIKHWFSFTANVGASAYTSNLHDSLSPYATENLGKYQNILQKTDWLLGVRNNTKLRFAGDAAMNFFTKHFNGSVTYRFIQPEYVSLGANSFSQNTHSLGLHTNFNMFKNRSILSLIGYIQRDNLNKKQMYTNQVATYTLNWINNISDHFSLNLSYNGIKQNEFDGTCVVPDSIRIDQITHTATISPVFTFYKGGNTHSISLNGDYIQNANLNKLSTIDIDTRTITAGIGYSVDLQEIRLNVGGNYDFSISRSTYSNYISNTLSAFVGYRLISTEKTNWNLNYCLSAGYNIMQDEGAKNNISFSNSLSTNFNYRKHHTASMYFSLSNYSDRIVIGQRIATDLDCRFTLSYTYSFAAKIIKKKSKGERQNKADRKAAKIMKQNTQQSR